MRPTLCAIGNFDGVHRGHRDILGRMFADSAARQLLPRVLTFDPHPAVVLGRTPPAVLTPLDRKIELLRRAVPGVEVIVRAFDEALAAMSPERFAREVLVGEVGAAHVLVGQNFRFGKGRAGDFATLAGLGAQLGFSAAAATLAGDARGAWSSTRVRAALAAGDLADVEGVLGRPHALTGTVVVGDQRGRQLGFPTANLGGVAEQAPPDGVYAVLVDRLDAGAPLALAAGVANIGVRPTVGAGRSIEAHLFDFAGDLYGARLRLHLVAHVRGERRFGGLDALKAQIASDAEVARGLLASRRPDPAAAGAWF